MPYLMEKGSYISILHLQIDQSVLSLVQGPYSCSSLTRLCFCSFLFLSWFSETKKTTLAVQDCRSLLIW